MFKSISVGNFKAFAETQKVPIKPITLIFGPNSSGKSSFIHSLLLNRHVVETGNWDVHRVNIGGDAVDLGGYRKYIHRHVLGRSMEFSIEINPQENNCLTKKRFSSAKSIDLRFLLNIDLTDTGGIKSEAKPEIKAVEVNIDNEPLIKMTRRPNNTMRIDTLNHSHPQFSEIVETFIKIYTTISKIDDVDRTIISNAINNAVEEISFEAGNYLPFKLSEKSKEKNIENKIIPISKKNREEEISDTIKLFIPNLVVNVMEVIIYDIEKKLLNIKYLGPLRSCPPRNFLFLHDFDDANWQSGGGVAWEIIRDNADIREKVNKWLGSEFLQTPYSLNICNFINPKSDEYINLIEETIENQLDVNNESDEYWLNLSNDIAFELRKKAEEVEKSLSEIPINMDKVISNYLNYLNPFNTDSSKIETTNEMKNHLLEKENRDYIFSIIKLVSDLYSDIDNIDVPLIINKDIIQKIINDNTNIAEKYRNIASEIEKNGEIIHNSLVEELPETNYENILKSLCNIDSFANFRDLELIDKRTNTSVSHKDVGVGISQVLPVLVNAFASKEQIVAIEQPEIHIHPALQAELGDVFIESALGEQKNTFIIETHSEHLILRILRRIRETTDNELPEGMLKIRPEDVAVIYAEPTKNGTIMKELRVDETGEFIDRWPGGFFTERGRELFG